jgi:hypothetical protein
MVLACAAVFATSFATSVHAQIPRLFPPEAKLAEMVGQKQPYPLLELDEKVLRMAPGGRVMDEHNRVVLHSYLPKHAHVLYVLDASGQVSRVFILRPDELKEAQLREPKPESKPDPKPGPKRNPKRSGS